MKSNIIRRFFVLALCAFLSLVIFSSPAKAVDWRHFWQRVKEIAIADATGALEGYVTTQTWQGAVVNGVESSIEEGVDGSISSGSHGESSFAGSSLSVGERHNQALDYVLRNFTPSGALVPNKEEINALLKKYFIQAGIEYPTELETRKIVSLGTPEFLQYLKGIGISQNFYDKFLENLDTFRKQPAESRDKVSQSFQSFSRSLESAAQSEGEKNLAMMFNDVFQNSLKFWAQYFGETTLGTLSIENTRGKIGNVVTIPVTMQNTLNEIHTLGFKVTYDPTVLKYAGFERGDLIPATFSQFSVNPIETNQLKIGGFSYEGSILPGASGNLVLLKFNVIGGSENNDCYSLTPEDMVDDIACFSATPGCFYINSCNGDINQDGQITPADALLVFKCYLGSGPCDECCDVNQDGEVTPKDALCLFQTYLGQSSCLDNTFTSEPVSHYNEPEAMDPMWDAPMEDISLALNPSIVEKSNTVINGIVTISDLSWLKGIPDIGPFLLILKSETPSVALFPNREVFLEHTVNPALIQADGSYSFPFTMVGYKPGKVAIKFFWKFRIFTEGACSVAIDGVYAGCALAGQLNSNCVCATLANLPAPGSWACRIHNITFRTVWSLWKCPGTSPF